MVYFYVQGLRRKTFVKSLLKDDRYTKKLYYVLIALVFVFYCYIAWNIPYTHDDWDWGSANGITMLLTSEVNSRYAGNLTEVIITRFPLLKCLYMGLVFGLIALGLTELPLKMLGEQAEYSVRVPALLLSNLMILCMPLDVWQQTYGWIAGFSNFVVSGLGILLFILALWYMLSYPEMPGKGIKAVGYFLLGLSIQLYIENLTVYILLVSLLFPIYAYRKNRGIPALFWPLLIGVLCGTVLMFSSGIYQSLWSKGEAVGGYRELTFEKEWSVFQIGITLCKRFFTEIIPMLIRNNGFLCLTMAVLSFGLIAFGKKDIKFIKNRHLLILCAVANGVYVLYFLVCLYYVTVYRDLPDPSPLFVVIDVCFVLLILAETAIAFRDEPKKLLCFVFVLLSAFAVLAPMVAVNTLGARSFFSGNVFLMLFCSMLFYVQLKHWPALLYRIVIFSLSLSMLGACAYYCKLYYDIGSVNRDREKIIKEAVASSAEEILLPAYPHTKYLWIPDPISDTYSDRFRQFYSISEDTKIWFEGWGERP